MLQSQPASQLKKNTRPGISLRESTAVPTVLLNNVPHSHVYPTIFNFDEYRFGHSENLQYIQHPPSAPTRPSCELPPPPAVTLHWQRKASTAGRHVSCVLSFLGSFSMVLLARLPCARHTGGAGCFLCLWCHCTTTVDTGDEVFVCGGLRHCSVSEASDL